MENNFINFRFIESFGECCAWTESAVSNAPARLGLKNHDTVKLVDKMQSGNDSLQKKNSGEVKRKSGSEVFVLFLRRSNVEIENLRLNEFE